MRLLTPFSPPFRWRRLIAASRENLCNACFNLYSPIIKDDTPLSSVATPGETKSALQVRLRYNAASRNHAHTLPLLIALQWTV